MGKVFCLCCAVAKAGVVDADGRTKEMVWYGMVWHWDIGDISEPF